LAARALFLLLVALKLWQLQSRLRQAHRRRQLERCWAL
jgi:CHASE1-domain containing sensor protein